MSIKERLKHKYALSEQGANDMIKAVIVVTIANLAFMFPVGLLYLLASDILAGGIPSSKLPMYIVGMVVSVLLIIITTYFQYNATFLATYVESGIRRRTLAEKLRKIPLSFFGKKDLSDLTSTIMGDCAWLETASSHFFPQLFGSMCSTTIVTICLFFFNVKMTLAAVWVLPVAFFVVFGARPISHRLNENAMKYKLECQDGIQEGLETVRDLKSYNATSTYMIGENGSELSGGERQRISIARAFLKDAPIILMDEATASLDVDNESLIQEALSKLIKDKTVLIIAHRMRTVDGVDKIVVLKDGVVAENGTPDELKAADGIYRHMVDLQLQAASWKL
jgi:ABC-type multidrug transport system fused ATPase/permease subunit